MSAIQTGFKTLDEMLDGGLPDGFLTLIASEPGIGKTALLLQIAANTACNGKRVMIFSMRKDEKTIREGKARQRIGAPEGSVLINDSARSSEDLARVLEENLVDAVFIDALESMNISYPRIAIESRGDRILKSSRSLCLLASEMKLPIVVTSTLSDRRTAPGTRPELRDLGASGIIDIPFDVILFPYREIVEGSIPPMPGEKAELIMVKNRVSCKVGSIPCRWNAGRQIFEEDTPIQNSGG